MADDGAGAAALHQLEAGWDLPAGVDVLDIGTPGPYFAEYLRGYEAVVVLDALGTAGEPGEIRLYRDGELPCGPAGTRLTPHAIDLGAARATLEFEGDAPRHWIAVGVVPGTIEAGTELTPAVRAAIPAMAAAAARALADLGHVLPARTVAPRLDWWQRGAAAPSAAG
jgi:hydrogenase maturation protease